MLSPVTLWRAVATPTIISTIAVPIKRITFIGQVLVTVARKLPNGFILLCYTLVTPRMLLVLVAAPRT